ncbi:hypothetical protein K501DRAFT_337803 [Backusella circina FSU 941]|nr:hypothetical protein K501DRAFT_337803 [Backusella circina FSU 941]
MLCRRRLLFPFFLNIQEQPHRVYLSTLSNNTNTAKSKILTHAKADQLDKAHALIGQLPSKYAAYQAYNQIIKAHARQRHDSHRQRKASNLVEEMKKNGVTPSNQTYFQLILGMSNNSKQDLLPLFYEFLKLEGLKNYRRTPSKFKTIVRVVASQGHPQLLDMLTYTDQYCFELDKQTYTTAIVACALNENSLAMAEKLLHYARRKGKAEVAAYDILIRVHLTKRQDLKSASQIFSTMSKDGLDATPSIYTSFIKTYIKEPKEENNDPSLRIETVRRLWQAMMMIYKKQVPDISLITQMLGYYRRHGVLSDAEQLYLDTTKKMHIKLDRAALWEMNNLILAFLKRKQIHSVLSLHYDLLGLGYYRPNGYVMQEIIKLLCERGDKETAEQLIQITTETPNSNFDRSGLEEILKEDYDSTPYFSFFFIL